MKNWSTTSGYKIIRILAGRSNVFLLSNSQSNILIDTSPEFMWKTLQRRLNKLQISHIDLLILTHSHFDHAANAQRIKEKYNAKVIIHQSEARYLSNGDNVSPSGTNPLTKSLLWLLGRKFNSLAKFEPCQYDLSADTTFNLNDLGFNAKIMHTPGHTPGSMSVIIDDEVALVGDTMFGVFCRTIYPPFANDTAQMINSWGKLLQTNSKIFIPSHGSPNSRSLVEMDYKKRTAAKY